MLIAAHIAIGLGDTPRAKLLPSIDSLMATIITMFAQIIQHLGQILPISQSSNTPIHTFRHNLHQLPNRTNLLLLQFSIILLQRLIIYILIIDQHQKERL